MCIVAAKNKKSARNERQNLLTTIQLTVNLIGKKSTAKNMKHCNRKWAYKKEIYERKIVIMLSFLVLLKMRRWLIQKKWSQRSKKSRQSTFDRVVSLIVRYGRKTSFVYFLLQLYLLLFTNVKFS